MWALFSVSITPGDQSRCAAMENRGWLLEVCEEDKQARAGTQRNAEIRGVIIFRATKYRNIKR